MAKARTVFWLQGALSAAGLLITLAALALAAARIDFALPSTAALLDACRRWALPHSAASAAVLLLGSTALAALVLTARSALRQLRVTRRARRGLQPLGPLPGHLGAVLFDDPRPRAFCAGFVRPRPYLSTGALALLAADERAAVVAHETHHARRRDPLRLLVTRALADGLFFLPAARRLADRYAALAELAADEAAVRATHGREALASALLAFDGHSDPVGVGVAPERVDHLLGEHARWELPVTLLAAATVTLGALTAVLVRMAHAPAHASIALPEVLAQACMLAMAVLPVLVGAGALLAGRRALRTR